MRTKVTVFTIGAALAVAAALLVGHLATAQAVLQVTPDEVSVTCAAGGTTGATTARKTYIVTALNEVVNYKWAASCGTGGATLNIGNERFEQAAGATVCCRSTGSTGILKLIPRQYVPNPAP